MISQKKVTWFISSNHMTHNQQCDYFRKNQIHQLNNISVLYFRMHDFMSYVIGQQPAVSLLQDYIRYQIRHLSRGNNDLRHSGSFTSGLRGMQDDKGGV